MNPPADHGSDPAVRGGAARAAAPARTIGQRLRWPLMLGGPLLVALAAAYVYLFGGRYVSTDDAYVQAAQVSISSNVAGRVAAVEVQDNQAVRRGQVLFRLDDQPYRIAVAAARARLGNARLQVQALKATYRQNLSELQAAQETLAYQQHEYERQQRLVASGISSRSQFEQAQHAAEAARQEVASTRQRIAAVLASLGGDPGLPVEQHPTVQQAQAELDRAALDLSYTVIAAPDDGVVAKVEQLQAGNYIAAASPVFALVSTRDLWIEANFKETQLAYMRPGQRASVRIDTYPGRRFEARVVSVSPGTGSQFSALPPENATGNWVKVVQRLPVRLELQGLGADTPLHAGVSADVEVDTGHRRWSAGAVPAPP